MKFILIFLFLNLVLPSYANPIKHKHAVGPRNFAQAKKVLPQIYKNLEEDFYCGCPYYGKNIDLRACGYIPRKSLHRASRLEWEHVVPAWVIGHQRQCWQKNQDKRFSGRKHCTATDEAFARAEGDLNNLVPAVGEVNGDRQHFRFSMWASHPTPMYGACQTIIDFKHRRIQPRPAIRGRIARIQFYMAEQYQLKLSNEDKQILCQWSGLYPVDSWERVRNQRIEALQGKGNRFVTELDAATIFCAKKK